MADRDLDVAQKLGEHSGALRALEGRVGELVTSQQETGKAVLRIEGKINALPVPPVPPDCAALHESLREKIADDTSKAIESCKRPSSGWDKRTIIALLGLLITIFTTFGGIVWYFGSTFSELKAQITERPAAAYYSTETDTDLHGG